MLDFKVLCEEKLHFTWTEDMLTEVSVTAIVEQEWSRIAGVRASVFIVYLDGEYLDHNEYFFPYGAATNTDLNSYITKDSACTTSVFKSGTSFSLSLKIWLVDMLVRRVFCASNRFASFFHVWDKLYTSKEDTFPHSVYVLEATHWAYYGRVADITETVQGLTFAKSFASSLPNLTCEEDFFGCLRHMAHRLLKQANVVDKDTLYCLFDLVGKDDVLHDTENEASVVCIRKFYGISAIYFKWSETKANYYHISHDAHEVRRLKLALSLQQ